MTIYRPALITSGTLFIAILVFAACAAAQPVLTTIYSFTGGTSDGEVPEGGLAIGRGGVLYGTTEGGGTFGYGTVFSLTPPTSFGGGWTEDLLYSFQGGNDGINPNSTLAIGSRGVLYGTTFAGGSGPTICDLQSCGTVFALTPPTSAGGHWTEAVLHSFIAFPEPRSLDPLYLEGIFAYEISAFGFSYLTNYDANGAIVPDVAREVPTIANGGISADRERITYRLRHGVRWQDGVPLTSRDVVFTYRAVMNPRNAIPSRYGFDRISSVSAPRSLHRRRQNPRAVLADRFGISRRR